MRLLARLVLVAAFLFAQAGGVMHEIWHATADQALDGKAPQKNPLCDFHTALGNVLGAIGCAAHATTLAATADTAFAAADSPAARFSTLAPQPRGPPAPL